MCMMSSFTISTMPMGLWEVSKNARKILSVGDEYAAVELLTSPVKLEVSLCRDARSGPDALAAALGDWVRFTVVCELLLDNLVSLPGYSGRSYIISRQPTEYD